MNTYEETIRTFKTKQFAVTVSAEPHWPDDLSWDENGEVANALNDGSLVCFTAVCRVRHKTLGEVGSDYLGDCIYESADDFQDHRDCAAQTRELKKEGSSAVVGSHFSDMIVLAIAEARKNIEETKSVYIRKNGIRK